MLEENETTMFVSLFPGANREPKTNGTPNEPQGSQGRTAVAARAAHLAQADRPTAIRRERNLEMMNIGDENDQVS